MFNFINTEIDFSGVFFSKTRGYRLKLLQKCSTIISKLIFFTRNIKIGNNNKFVGVPYVYRNPNTKIELGSDCIFRSDSTSNLIGIKGRCIISSLGSDSHIYIGNKCGFSGTVIGAKTKIYIGNGVLCGANTVITDFDWHPTNPLNRHTSIGVKSAPVYILDNVWLGLNVVVLKGVTIGENSIIGPNSVVVRDIPANVIAGGNPCKVIKEL